ncbi:hypothetical protein AWENTII_004639 [Aspergillus wentii]
MAQFGWFPRLTCCCPAKTPSNPSLRASPRPGPANGFCPCFLIWVLDFSEPGPSFGQIPPNCTL